jgi:streptomycin 6-kinase
VVPAALARNVAETWGQRGLGWLESLPDVLIEVCRDWELLPGDPYDLSFNWVSRVTRAGGGAAVLKLGPPWPGHLAGEAVALEAFAGRGAVRLLARDDERGALLLECADPGTPASVLVPGRDEEATSAAIGLLRQLHSAELPERGLPPLEGHGEAFTRYLRRYPGYGPLPRHLVERAAELFGDLCATAPRRVVLHGDLHHTNIVRAQRQEWLAIDPHGAAGDPGFDTGALLYNPDPDRVSAELLGLVPARIEQLADGLEMPVGRVTSWGFVMGVLSEVWTTEGEGTPGCRALAVAELLLPRLP